MLALSPKEIFELFCIVLLLTRNSFIDLMKTVFLGCIGHEASLEGILIFIYFSMSNHSNFDTQELLQDAELHFLLDSWDHLKTV